MSITQKAVANDLPLFDRRVHLRAPVRSVAYVALDEGNGGIILNISEGGMSVHAFVGMVDDLLSNMRLQLSESRDWVEAPARIAWRSESKKVAGLQFVDLPDHTRKQIRELLSRENTPSIAHKPITTIRRKLDEAEPEQSFLSTVRRAQELPKPGTYTEFPSERPTSVASASDSSAPSGSAPKSETLVFGRTLAYPQNLKHEPVRSAREKAARSGRTKGNRIAIAAGAVFLATASLAVGWETGRGALGKAIDGVSHVSWSAAFVSQKPPQIPAGLIPTAPEIERVATEQPVRPAIAALPPKPVETPARRGTPPTPPTPVRKPPETNYSWTPSSPVHTRPTEVSTEDAGDSPPSATIPTAPEMSFLSPGAADIHPLAPPAHSAALNRSTLIHRVDPAYPAFAMQNKIEGSVEMKVTVGQDGAVRRIEPVSGQKVLLDAAMDAVRQWRYTPTVLDGKPIQTEVDITLQFQLPALK